MAGLIVLVVAGIVIFFILYGKMLSRAAIAERLIEENRRLKRYQYKVKLLEENLTQAQEIVGRLAKLAGIDYTFPDLPDDSALLAQAEPGLAAALPLTAGGNTADPVGLPVRGFVSQGFEVKDRARFHPGIDIVCAEGTPVTAPASGVVVMAAFDSTYGEMVVLRHNDSVSTVYGHNRQLLVKEGDVVQAGSRIALSGNTGKSTAPHVHYEIRLNGEPINPLENPYDKENKL
ncbi:MAG TPA: M23 family metallopeptidase [Candidatus Deferrimicrobium sp.]|nr:M23 family metallopeptidase [Candidatus Deferrimicrobium sp.]